MNKLRLIHFITGLIRQGKCIACPTRVMYNVFSLYEPSYWTHFGILSRRPHKYTVSNRCACWDVPPDFWHSQTLLDTAYICTASERCPRAWWSYVGACCSCCRMPCHTSHTGWSGVRVWPREVQEQLFAYKPDQEYMFVLIYPQAEMDCPLSSQAWIIASPKLYNGLKDLYQFSLFFKYPTKLKITKSTLFLCSLPCYKCGMKILSNEHLWCDCSGFSCF